MDKYFFTFGSNQKDKNGMSLANYYFELPAQDFFKARKKMFALRKSDWSFQYTEKEFEGQKEKYNFQKNNYTTASLVDVQILCKHLPTGPT